MQQRRVVVTGIGAVTSLGNNVAEFWEGLRAGRSGAGTITRFKTNQFKTKIACEVKNFDAKALLGSHDAHRLDRFGQFASIAAREAMEDAAIAKDDVEPSRLGVILGIGIGGFETLENAFKKLSHDGPRRIRPMTIPKLISNIAPAHIAIQYHACGPVYSLATACASGTDAIGNATRLILAGETDVMITGGVEASITPMGVSGFNALKALSVQYNDNPSMASRPFEKNRDGFVMGEGAGLLVLEEMQRAKQRGASNPC